MWADEFNPLVDWWDSHRHGLLTMKFTHYFDIYHRHLQHFRGKKAHLLEIGVASGGSLQMWKAGAEVLHLKIIAMSNFIKISTTCLHFLSNTCIQGSFTSFFESP